MSVVLVDTSVWIDYLRKPTSTTKDILDKLMDDDNVCTCYTVQYELFPYLKNEDQFLKFHLLFSRIPLISENDLDWPGLMHTAFLLKRKGISGFGLGDAIIAHLAAQHNKVVFTLDGDFKNLAKAMTIRLLDFD